MTFKLSSECVIAQEALRRREYSSNIPDHITIGIHANTTLFEESQDFLELGNLAKY